jgi:hypothetical protein
VCIGGCARLPPSDTSKTTAGRLTHGAARTRRARRHGITPGEVGQRSLDLERIARGRYSRRSLPGDLFEFRRLTPGAGTFVASASRVGERCTATASI